MWGGRPPADYRVDRPEVEAPRGAREPTGTNGPTLTNTYQPHWLTDTIECSSNHYTDHNQHKPPTGETRILVEPLVVVIAAGKRPASIPNLEAKPASADGTAPGRVWESRTPPQHSIQRVGPGTRSFQAPPVLSYAGHAHTRPRSTYGRDHTPKPNHTLPVSVCSIRARNAANTHALRLLAYPL